ncbi:MAG: cytochrome c-type biogenesis protein CcmH [Oligoflexia bacterium]|nr:cytochrome c-type biogenesis protein CcmH [Oligoflexia bacterium]
MALRVLLTALLCLLSVSGPAQALDLPQEKEAQAQSIFDSVMSPFCPGRLLRDCPSGKAHDLKEQIRAMVSDGRSNQQIEESLYQQFGEIIRATPKSSGVGLLGWLAPGFFLIAGLIFVLAWIKGKTASLAVTNSLSEKELSPEMQARIEREIQGR